MNINHKLVSLLLAEQIPSLHERPLIIWQKEIQIVNTKKIYISVVVVVVVVVGYMFRLV
jgi:hypothetical protein